MDMSEYAEPSPTELEQIVDEARRMAGTGPAPRDPATGIADMNARIEYHTNLIARLRRQVDSELVRQLIADSQLQIGEARQRLAEYRLQAQSPN